MNNLSITMSCIGFLAAAFTAQGAVTCTTADYNGVYAFRTIGSFVRLPPAAALLQGAFSQAGTFAADGQGNLAVTSTSSYNGNVLPANDEARYTVSPDCTLKIYLTLPLPLAVSATFETVLSGNNRENTVMVTDPPGTVVVGRHRKLDLKFCSVADFQGSYSIDMTGQVAVSAQNVAAGPFQRVGRLLSDGNGGFTATTFANYNGNTVEEDISGTYTLNSGCALSLKYTTGTGPAMVRNILVGALGGHGEIVMLMVATHGWSVSGTLRSQ
jgi:hypothetical protein